MTNHAPFDDHIKKKLGNLSPEVPSHIWENIIAEKDNNKPAGFLFFMQRHGIKVAILALLLTAGGVFVWNGSRDKDSNSSNELANTKATSNSTTNEQKDKINENNNNSSSANNNSTDKNNNNTTSNDHEQSTTNTDAANNNFDATVKSNTQQNTTTNNNNLTSNKKITTTPVTNKTRNNKPTIVTGNDNTGNASSTRFTKKRTTKQKTKLSATDGSLDSDNPVAANTTVDTKDIPSVTPADVIDANNNDATEQEMRRSILNPDPVIAQKMFNPTVSNLHHLSLNIPCPSGEKNAAGNKRYFEIYGGPDYVFRSFSDTANSVYLEKRKESTKFSSAFSAGFRFTKVFSNGMSFRTGLNYSQVNERFRFVEGNIIQVIYITDAAGDTTGSYEAVSTRYKTTHNKFRTLDIPLMIGFEMGNGRLHTNINAGGIVNLRSWQEGDVLDESFKPVALNSGTTSSPYQFKTNIGLGFMGAVSLYYKLTEKLHLLAEPYFRYNFSPASKSEITFKQKYTTAGLRLGVRLDF